MASSPGNNDLVTLKVFPQDPLSKFKPVPVKVRGGILPGPVGSRIAVYDYNRDRDEVYAGSRPTEDGTFPECEPGDLRFHQLNAYAIVARAIELVELELGRSLQWGFDAGRLIVLPHAGYLANAFYSKETHSLQFYSFTRDGSKNIFHTSLSHDVVAHETGHAILDAVRGRYTEAWEAETAAIHEAVGDLTAVFAGLSHDVVLEDAAADLSKANYVSQIAEHFLGVDQPLRNLIGRPKSPSYWSGETTPHGRSLQLTRAIYAALIDMHEKSIDIEADRISALKLARRALQRMVVRGLDHLPPADATFDEFGTAMLNADQFANEQDKYGFRRIVEAKLKKHGILAGNNHEQEGRPWPHQPRSWPFLTVSDAYEFLDRNRKRLALSKYRDYRDFVIRSVHRATAPAKRPRGGAGDANGTEKVIIVYEYPVEVELKGRIFGEFEGHWITVRGGGTLIFDAAGNLKHHARKAVTRRRINRILTFLKDGLAGRYIQPTGDGPADEMRQGSIGRAWLLKLSSGRAELSMNAAARCNFQHMKKETR